MQNEIFFFQSKKIIDKSAVSQSLVISTTRKYNQAVLRDNKFIINVPLC